MKKIQAHLLLTTLVCLFATSCGGNPEKLTEADRDYYLSAWDFKYQGTIHKSPEDILSTNTSDSINYTFSGIVESDKNKDRFLLPNFMGVTGQQAICEVNSVGKVTILSGTYATQTSNGPLLLDLPASSAFLQDGVLLFDYQHYSTRNNTSFQLVFSMTQI